MPTTTVTSTRDLDLVSSLLARAFADDPVLRWMQPDRGRDKQIFDVLVRWVHGADAVVDLAERDAEPMGAAVWDPPGTRMSALQQIGSVQGFLRACRGRIRRGVLLEQEFAKRRPREPHWYLGQVGAVVQGRGVGSALLTSGIERVDGPAYLESSNEANVPLYERFGFEVREAVTLPLDGPTVWTMYRRG